MVVLFTLCVLPSLSPSRLWPFPSFNDCWRKSVCPSMYSANSEVILFSIFYSSFLFYNKAAWFCQQTGEVNIDRLVLLVYFLNAGSITGLLVISSMDQQSLWQIIDLISSAPVLLCLFNLALCYYISSIPPFLIILCPFFSESRSTPWLSMWRVTKSTPVTASLFLSLALHRYALTIKYHMTFIKWS